LARLRDQGTTIVLVEEKSAHVLELADTVALMQLGRVVWNGPRDELDMAALTSAYLGDAAATPAGDG
jgi:ABC-type branched-subunit amino acid transport system ATPase component